MYVPRKRLQEECEACGATKFSRMFCEEGRVREALFMSIFTPKDLVVILHSF